MTSAPADQTPCPCGSGDGYPSCCGPLHAGSARAATAEQLMRSRYSAFAVGDGSYLRLTWDPRTVPDDLELDPGTTWTRLRVLAATEGGPDDATGTVTFRAHWTADGERGALAEHSRFARGPDGAWLYVDGDVAH